MLNFLVAEVGQTYENVMSAGMTLIFRTRASMNVKALLYSEILSKEQSDNEFSVLLITAPKNCKENVDPGDEEYYGMLNNVIKVITKLIKKTK